MVNGTYKEPAPGEVMLEDAQAALSAALPEPMRRLIEAVDALNAAVGWSNRMDADIDAHVAIDAFITHRGKVTG